MNSVIVDPALAESHPNIERDLYGAAKDARLEVIVSIASSLESSVQAALNHKTTTVIAYGGFDWYDRVISEMCRSYVQHGNKPPIFGHIQPPKLPTVITQRLPAAYSLRHLKSAYALIAQRKIVEKPAFTCSKEIWFTHSLSLAIHDAHHLENTRLLIQTPRGSNFALRAPIESLEITVNDSIQLSDTSSANLTIAGIAASKVTKNTDTLLTQKEVESLKQSNSNKPTKSFQVLMSKASIHAPQRLFSAHFNREIPAHCTIEAADFAIQVITEKNLVGKY